MCNARTHVQSRQVRDEWQIAGQATHVSLYMCNKHTHTHTVRYVMKGDWRGMPVVCKVLKNKGNAADDLDFQNEISVLSHLRHPNLVGLPIQAGCKLICGNKLIRSLVNVCADMCQFKYTIYAAGWYVKVCRQCMRVHV